MKGNPMNTVRRYSIALTLGLALTCVPTNVFAKADKPQEKPEKRERPATQRADKERGGKAAQRGERLDKFLAELNLTDDQKTQIDAVRKETREKLAALKGQLKDLTPEERRAKVKEAAGDVRGKIMAILTDEQKAQLKEKMQAAKAEAGGDGKPARKAKKQD